MQISVICLALFWLGCLCDNRNLSKITTLTAISQATSNFSKIFNVFIPSRLILTLSKKKVVKILKGHWDHGQPSQFIK